MNQPVYRSPYEAYPFLADAPEDLRCDFEIMTDRMSSETGLSHTAHPYDGDRGRGRMAEGLCRKTQA